MAFDTELFARDVLPQGRMQAGKNMKKAAVDFG